MKNLHRISILYLILPFLLFLFGWVRLTFAIPIAIILLFALWQLLKNTNPITNTCAARKCRCYQLPNFRSLTTVYCLLITAAFVFLSGVGGYTFQNWDHHWRNAVLRDLITYNWPVIYSAPEQGPIKMLVYYVGYWLPSALVGKVFGWEAANFFLFLWTWLGILLVAYHLGNFLKISPIKSALLLILFSGMDALGALLFARDYPTLWPPIQHLEIWAGTLQYSSFTTQLFWVFNQAVPAWLCISMFVTLSKATLTCTGALAGSASEGLQSNGSDSSLAPKEQESVARHLCRAEVPSDINVALRKLRLFLSLGTAMFSRRGFTQNDARWQLTFVWSLCFFFAPLASIGLFPYLLIDLVKRTDFKNPFKGTRIDLLLASFIVVVISYLFFSSNTAAQERGFQSFAIKDFIIFFLFEGGILWLLLAPVKWRDPYWAVTGILLFIMPFIQLGSGRDFVMRASIAPLFYLMMMVGEALFQKTTSQVLRFTFLILLLIGALTPLYEINRSVYRAVQYYFLTDHSQLTPPGSEIVTHLEQGVAPEMEHPDTLTADDIRTLKFMDDKLSKNFIANVRQSLYYRYISPR
ncbi:MAG: hypothetical protein HY863_13885 [Chloroflexi bacterium]|nr:hypothetical protein [Chloroflexota bacterium]